MVPGWPSSGRAATPRSGLVGQCRDRSLRARSARGGRSSLPRAAYPCRVEPLEREEQEIRGYVLAELPRREKVTHAEKIATRRLYANSHDISRSSQALHTSVQKVSTR